MRRFSHVWAGIGDSVRIAPTAERADSPDLFFACRGRAGVSKIDGGSTGSLSFGVILFVLCRDGRLGPHYPDGRALGEP